LVGDVIAGGSAGLGVPVAGVPLAGGLVGSQLLPFVTLVCSFVPGRCAALPADACRSVPASLCVLSRID